MNKGVYIRMSSKKVQYIFLSVFLFITIGLGYTSFIGKKQDVIYKQDFLQFQQAVQSIETNEQDKGIEALEELVKKYPNEYFIYYQLGMAYSAKTDFQKAAINYQKALNIRPALLEDQQFTFKMGEALFHIGEMELAQTYLTMPVPKEFEKQKEQFLNELQSKLKS